MYIYANKCEYIHYLQAEFALLRCGSHETGGNMACGCTCFGRLLLVCECEGSWLLPLNCIQLPMRVCLHVHADIHIWASLINAETTLKVMLNLLSRLLFNLFPLLIAIFAAFHGPSCKSGFVSLYVCMYICMYENPLKYFGHFYVLRQRVETIAYLF